jgi:polyisoprenoid-binding protein YceI
MKEGVADIRWNLYRTKAGAWVVFSSTPATYTSMERKRVEEWLTIHGGLRPEELDTLFQDAEEKGEGVVTISLLRGIEQDS